MRKQSLVCDTSPLLYLGRMENEDLLQMLFEKVYVTEHLGLKVVGMIGILLKAKRAGLLSSVRPFLEVAQTHGFRMAKELYVEAVRLAGEENE